MSKTIKTDNEFVLACEDLGVDQDTAYEILAYHGRDYCAAYQEVLELTQEDFDFDTATDWYPFEGFDNLDGFDEEADNYD